MKKKILFSLLTFGFFFVIILLFTHGLFNNFFEQDEWGAFGDVIYSYNQPWWSILVSKGVHFTPLGAGMWAALYKMFGLQAQFYTLTALFMQAFASFLVFILASRLSGSKKVGLLTGILFAVNGRDNSAYTHLAVFSTVIGAFIFTISFFIYLIGIKSKYFSKKNIIVLFSLFLGAVFFREEGFIIAPLFILYLLIFDKVKFNKRNIKSFISLSFGILLLLLLRLFSQHLNVTSIPVGSTPSLKPFIYNLPTLPIKFVVHNLIDSNRLFFFLLDNSSKIYNDISLPFPDVYPILMDFSDFIIITFIFIVFGIWAYRSKYKKILSFILFFLGWLICNSFVLSVVGRNIYKIDPRYLYFSSFPVLFLTSLFSVSILQAKYKNKLIGLIKKSSVIFMIALLLVTSYQDIQIAVKQKEFTGIARQKLLKSILAANPKLPKNTIIYIKCRTECYRNAKEFGLPTTYALPFLAGTGLTILVGYSKDNETTWGKFLTNSFLLDRGTQGYKKVDKYGFGFFIDKELLRKTLKSNKLSKDIVIALEYNEEQFTVRDISKKFREELGKEL